MRHPFAITAGLLLTAFSIAGAQNAPVAEQLPQVPASPGGPVVSAEKTLHATGRPVHPGHCSSCAVRPADPCSNPCCARYRLIAKRYYWVPAATVGIHARVVGSRWVTRRVSGIYGQGYVSPRHVGLGFGHYTSGRYTRPYNGPLFSRGYTTGGFTAHGCGSYQSSGIATGGVSVRPFTSAPSSVLPASPYRYHPSYDLYSQGTYTQAYGTYGYGTGVVGAGYSTLPVYPTVQFRGTRSVVRQIPAPHYSAY